MRPEGTARGRDRTGDEAADVAAADVAQVDAAGVDEVPRFDAVGDPLRQPGVSDRVDAPAPPRRGAIGR